MPTTPGLAWQAVLQLMAYDAKRCRPLIWNISRSHWIAPAVMDGTLGVLFIVAFLLTGDRHQ